MSSTIATDPTVTAARAAQDACTVAEVAKLVAVIDWAVAHEPVHLGRARHVFEEPGLCLAGAGAPLVAEYATFELAAAMGMSSDAGVRYVGRALELRYRLPKIWSRVITGEIAVWRAFRVAENTMLLPLEGARYVDVHLAWRLPKLSLAQQERTIAEALVRFDPDTAEAKRLHALEGRHVDVGLDQVSFDGTVEVAATLDVADAMDLEHAITAGAKALAQTGCVESLDVRRSMAVGVLARGDQTLDLQTRPLVIHVHDDHVGLLEITRSNVSVEQVAAWCGSATKVTTSTRASPLVG